MIGVNESRGYTCKFAAWQYLTRYLPYRDTYCFRSRGFLVQGAIRGLTSFYNFTIPMS
jgi:hypothetical protein